MTGTVSSWGNSQGVRFPKSVLDKLHLSVGDRVKVVIENHKIIIEPMDLQKEKYDINQLVKQMPKDYKPYEEFDSKAGVEEW